MWQIKNIPLRHGKFKARYDAALSTKTAMMRHYLQSPLLHSNTLQNLKIIFTKPKFLFGIYYTVMLFSLKNAGATYQRAMTAIFHDMMHKEIEDYVDDVVVKSKTRGDHLAIL